MNTDQRPTITPQPGKRYVTRSGKLTTPIRHSPDPNYPFWAEIEDTGNPYFWTVVGSYYYDREPHPHDLVAEYVEAAPPTEPPPFRPPAGSFQSELTALINRHSLESGSGTPDYILAEFLRQCLDAFDRATRQREEHKRA